MSTLSQTIIRCRCDVDAVETPFMVWGEAAASGSNPSIWAGCAVEFQLAWERAGTLLDLSNLSSIQLRIFAATRTGAAYADQTVQAASLDLTLDETTWADGTKQHASFSFTAEEMNLSATIAGTEYYLELRAYTTAAPTQPIKMGWTRLFAVLGGADSAAPVQAGNIVPSGATYDGSGEYALTVLAARYYKWTQGANDTSAVNGTETITTSNANFITQSTTVTLHGTAGELVTAVVRPSPYLTADEVNALITSLIGGIVTLKQGSQVLVAGEEVVTLDYSAHALGSTPSRIVPIVISPPGGDKLGTPEVVSGSATATQCQVQLANPVPASGYSLGYILIQ